MTSSSLRWIRQLANQLSIVDRQNGELKTEIASYRDLVQQASSHQEDLRKKDVIIKQLQKDSEASSPKDCYGKEEDSVGP